MSILDDIRSSLGTWFDSVLGGPLDAALATVRQAMAAGTAHSTIQPQVQGFVSSMETWAKELARLEAAATAITPPDPQIAAYVVAIKEKHGLMWTQFSDPSALRPTESLGFLPAIPAATAVVFTAVCAVAIAGLGTYAVSDVGAAWAVANATDAQSEADRTKLAANELEARVQLIRQGKTLPPTTLPGLVKAPDTDGLQKAAMVAVGAAGVAVVVGGLAWLLSRSR